MTKDSDEALWTRSLAGDHAAFGMIFERHARRVYNHCFRKTASWSHAEDLTSVVFLVAWKRRDDVHFVENSLLPWLLGVATNVCRNADRSLRRHQRALGRLVGLPTEVDRTDEIDDRLDAEAAMSTVLSQISADVSAYKIAQGGQRIASDVFMVRAELTSIVVNGNVSDIRHCACGPDQYSSNASRNTSVNARSTIRARLDYEIYRSGESDPIASFQLESDSINFG